MVKVRKIFQAILIAAFICLCSVTDSYAWERESCPDGYSKVSIGSSSIMKENWNGKGSRYYTPTEDEKKLGYVCAKIGPDGKAYANPDNPQKMIINDPPQSKQEEVKKEETEDTPSTPITTNDSPSETAVTGCSSNYGLFSGLINTGRKVFSGLRDLIYVVAGFGIIGVAVGGFFGNLNWKWLGAIIISLVVIATTGELINLITGCEKFTNAAITDTLK